MTSTHAPIQPLPAKPLALTCHSATPCRLDLRLSVALAAAGSETGAGWLLHYRVTGDTAGLLVPPAITPGPADGLWQHTCFEAFVAQAGEPAYREFNFSPSGQWAAYRFSAERVRDLPAEAAAPACAPELVFLEQPQSLDLQVWLPREALPEAATGAPVILGLSAVLETRDGQLSYWALHHPATRPDFHHRAGFVHVLDLPPFPTPPVPLNLA